MIKDYKKTEIQVCSECNGEGVQYVIDSPATHKADTEVGHWEICKTCNGERLLKVTADVKVTVEPYYVTGREDQTSIKPEDIN
jgi:DnaJ-class molecular chaperone